MNKILHIIKLGWTYKISKATYLSYPPYQYTIEPTNVCNYKCDFCPQSDPEHHKRRKKGYLTIENFRLFLEKRRKAGPGNRNINLTLDGEPLLNKDFPEFIRMAVSENLFPIFASNASRLDNETVDKMVSFGPFGVSVDFSPDKNIFESIRSREGDYDTVLQNLRYLVDKATSNSRISVNINDISSFAEPSSDEENPIMLRKLFPAKISRNISFRVRQFHNFCGHLEKNHQTDSYRICPYPYTQMAVTWDGLVVPCCRDTAARSVLGNLFENDVMDIWNNNHYRQFRQNLIDRKPHLNSACAECDLPFSGHSNRWKPAYILRSLTRR
jgi:radical SAM protein with 4Fe4S-binding SPASM domain